MTFKKFFRKAHRWLGLLMAVQIIAWMASGLWFSIFPIETIRGEHLTRPLERLDLDRLEELAALAEVQQALDSHFEGTWTLSSLELIRLDDRVHWRVSAIQSTGAGRRQASVAHAFGRSGGAASAHLAGHAGGSTSCAVGDRDRARR